MQIVIFSRKKSFYSTRRLYEAAVQKGHNAEIINPLDCQVNVNAKDPSLYYNGQKLPHFDAAIPRIGHKSPYYSTTVVRQIEACGTYSINPSIAITRARDKLRSLQLLSRKRIDLPRTGFAHSPDHIVPLIDLVGGPPVVIKLLEGTQGVGVVLAETQKAAESVMQAFFDLGENIIVQEYIRESKGADIRCIVLGGKVIAAMKRQAEPGEFRSNIHRGGKATPVKITNAEKRIAVQATKIIGLGLAGVDLIRSSRGPLVIEVNSSPGLEGIESTTGIDIASIIVDQLVKSAKPSKRKTRYEG